MNVPTISKPNVLKSRKFWTMLIEAAFIIFVSLVPELEQTAPQLIEASVIVAGLVIGGYAAEDMAAAYKTGNINEKYN